MEYLEVLKKMTKVFSWAIIKQENQVREMYMISFLKFLFYLFNLFFVFSCIGSSLLHVGFL